MLDLKSKAQPLDAKHINIHQPYEVSFWCNYFNCSMQRLKEAIAVVGTSVADVRKFLCK